MKRKLFPLITLVGSIFLLTACTSDNIPFTDAYYLRIPDAKFETALIKAGIDSDGTVNQLMLRADALAIKSLELNNKDIKDLSGIEGFKQLTKLAVAQNELTQIDLSENTQLDTLYIQANALTTLDLSKQKKLIYLDADSNLLTTVSGLSHTPDLETIRMSFNYLTSFEISNSGVKHILMSDNDLTSFKIHQTPQLTAIFIKTNKLATIDLTHSPQLESLVISDNKLTT
jgi:Leucine-rich repeat (LRR) protein